MAKVTRRRRRPHSDVGFRSTRRAAKGRAPKRAAPAAQAARAWVAARVRETRYRGPFHFIGLGLVIVVGALVLAAWMAGVTGGVAAAGSRALDQGLLAAGFGVDHIDVRGAARTDVAEISRRLMIEEGELVFHFRPEDARARIEELPWVRRAAVMRLLPNRLVVIVEERQPLAQWRESADADIVVVDDAGEVISGADAGAHSGLVLVEGPGAPLAAAALARTLDEHREISSRASHFVRVGERRWDMVLRDGGVVLLPERAGAGLSRLEALQAAERILDWPIESLDLRNGDLVVRGRPADPIERGA